MLLEGYYHDHMFLRVGYYVSVENPLAPPVAATIESVGKGDDGMDIENSEGEDDEEEEEEEENNKAVEMTDAGTSVNTRPVNIADIRRNILAGKPRVTCLPIDWGASDLSSSKLF